MQRADSLEKTLMLGRIGGRRRRGWQRMRWLNVITNLMDMGLGRLRELVMDRRPGVLRFMGLQKSDMTERLNWSEKLKIELPCDPAIPLLDIYSEKMQTQIWEDICTPVFIATLFTPGDTWKQSKCLLIDEWIKRMCYACMHTHTHQLWKKKWMPLAVLT